MDFQEILRTRRTVRLYQQKEIPYKELEECVDCARMAPSARNLQPFEYIVVDFHGPLEEIFSCMGFGGGVTSFRGKEPTAYVVVLVNKELKGNWTSHDCGLAVENLVLAVWEKGIGSCILARINREKIREILEIPETHEIELVVTMGYPAEKPVAEDMELQTEGGKSHLPRESSTSSYRDAKGTLHVPKRRLKDVLHRNGF